MKSRAHHLIILALLLNIYQPVFAAQVKVTATLVEPEGGIGTVQLLPTRSPTLPIIYPVPPGPPGRSESNIRFFALTIPEDITIALTGEGAGSRLILPSGLKITAPAWDGNVNIAYTNIVPTAATGMNAGKAVSVQFNGMTNTPVKLSEAAIIVIPYPNFGNTTNVTVKVIDITNTIPYTLSPCSNTQYTNGTLADAKSYSLGDYALAGAQHCYKFDDLDVYAITNHFSTFMVEVAPPPTVVPPPPPPSGGGSGSSSNFQLVSSSPTPPPVQIATPPPSTPPPTPPTPAAPDACQFEMIQPKKIYTDVALDSWYIAAVTRLTDVGVLKKKKPKELFKPSAHLKRYEALMLTMDAFGIKPEKSKSKDIFDGYMKAAKAKGIIVSRKPAFTPRGMMNRSEAIALLLRTAKATPTEYTNPTAKHYRDVAVSQWYFPFVMKATDLCIIASNAENRFNPLKFISRSEFIVMLDRAMQKLKK